MYALNPRTNRWERAEWFVDRYGKGQHGVKFEDGTIYNATYTKIKTR